MSTETNKQLKYRAYVDGLRAIAVLAVILFHAGLGLSGGYVGVDVFFVISGYLITGLILKDCENDQFHILDFWDRRVRRILPALAVVLVACLIAGWFLFFPLDLKDLGQSMLAQTMLVSNIYFYLNSGYFAEGTDVKPLLHTWSLAVEEQFYLCFPFLLIFLKRVSREFLVPAILMLCVVSFGLSVYCSYTHARANFYLPPTRAWELLIGSLLAAMPTQRASPRWLTESLNCGGLLAIFYAVFFYGPETRFPGAAALVPCGGAALIIWANSYTLTSVGRLLAARPIVFIGLISYSLYLWHWPVIVFFKYWALGPIPVWQRLLLLVASLGLAVLSWKFVETPFRKRVVFKNQSRIFVFGAVTTGTLFFAGLGIYKLQGLPSRVPAQALHYLAGSSVAVGGGNPLLNRVLDLRNARDGDFNEMGKGETNSPIELLVWGDSHAQVMLPILDILCKEHSARGVAATHSQTAPLVGYESHGDWSLNTDSIGFNNAVAEFISTKHVRDVLLIARWDYYLDIDKETGRLRRGLLATIKALQGSGARIWIMRQNPRYPWNVPKALASAVLHGRNPEELGRPLIEQRRESQRQDPIFEGLATMFPRVTVLDPTELFVDAAGRCRVAKDGTALYWDGDHVNGAGAMLLRPLFEPIFDDIGKTRTPIRGNLVSHQ